MNVLPLIFRKTKPFKSFPKYIVLHGTGCIGKDDQILKQDMKNKFQLPYLKKDTITMEGQIDVPFHFVIEHIGPDYEPMMMYPLSSPIDYFSKVNNNERSIHVCMFGNFNVDMAKPRLYEILSYRVLAPIMYWFRIPQSHIMLHSEVDKAHKDCPGEMFFKDILYSKLNKYLLRK